jgi:pyruvate-formate lyase-activating enzyme
MADRERDDWVERVLGVSVSGGEPVDLEAAAAAWREASEAVDGQIAALQQSLRAQKNGELEEIAEFGLNGVTGGFKVPLTAALLAAQRGGLRELAAIPRIAARFRAHIEADERVAACDANPFGVAVSIRAILVPALSTLERVRAPG